MDFDKTFRAISIRAFIFRFLIYFIYWLIFSYVMKLTTHSSPEEILSISSFSLIISVAFIATVFAFFFNKKNKHNVKPQFQKLIGLFPKSDQNLILLIIFSNIVDSRFDKTIKGPIRKMKITNFYARLPQKKWDENEIREIISTLKY